MRLRIVRRAAIGGFLLLAIHGPVYSQSLGLTPAEVRATFKPQQVLQFDLSVSNDGDAPVPMRASVMDLWFDSKTNEKIFGTPGSLPHSASNWITFVPPTFTLPPHGTGKVKVVVTPPPDAVGGSYAVLFVESKPELAGGGAQGRPIYANMRLGALILLSAEGTEEYRVEVSRASLTPPSAQHPLELTFDLKNSGNTHVFPEARLTIMNAAHKVVARADAEARRFFPGQKDTVTIGWSGRLPPGEYTGVLTVSYGGGKVYTETLPLQVPLRGDIVSTDAP